MKTIKFTLGLIAFLAVITGFTGCIIHEDDYNPPAQHNGYRYVFNEDFNNDRFGWTFDDPYDSAYAFVTQDGLYKFVDYSYNGGYHSAVVPTGANMNNNFLVQARIKSDYAMAVIFGASNSSYGYSFFIDNAGYFAVYKEGSPDTPIQTLVNWQGSGAIRNGWNDVEVEQVGNYWYGYINNVQVFEIPAHYVSGSSCGFMVMANTTGYADYLTVKW